MTADRRKTLFVTGAAGFVGAAVVRAALADGHRVAALVRTPNAARLVGLDVDCHAADLADTDRIAAILAEVRPDVVIHSAWEGVGGPLRADDIQFANITTTCALADAAIAVGTAKFVGIGSQADYGRFDRRITEADVPHPSMLYGAAKLAACHLARQRTEAAGVGFAWLRLFSVYGPDDNPNWLIPGTIAQLLDGRAPRTTAGTQRWDYLYIDDVARGILAAAVTESATGVFNLSSGAPATVRSIIERLRDRAAPGLPLRFGEVPFAPDQIMHLEGDNTRLRTATGWAPRIGLDEGLATTVDAMRNARRKAA
jgi:nucleoside-diphosphate-sugar epimerase